MRVWWRRYFVFETDLTLTDGNWQQHKAHQDWISIDFHGKKRWYIYHPYVYTEYQIYTGQLKISKIHFPISLRQFLASQRSPNIKITGPHVLYFNQSQLPIQLFWCATYMYIYSTFHFTFRTIGSGTRVPKSAITLQASSTHARHLYLKAL